LSPLSKYITIKEITMEEQEYHCSSCGKVIKQSILKIVETAYTNQKMVPSCPFCGYLYFFDISEIADEADWVSRIVGRENLF